MQIHRSGPGRRVGLAKNFADWSSTTGSDGEAFIIIISDLPGCGTWNGTGIIIKQGTWNMESITEDMQLVLTLLATRRKVL